MTGRMIRARADALRRNRRPEPPLTDQLSGSVFFVRSSMSRSGLPAGSAVCAPLRGVMCMAEGEREGNGCPTIRGNHMRSGIPSAPGLADGLRIVSFILLKAPALHVALPVPQHCTDGCPGKQSQAFHSVAPE